MSSYYALIDCNSFFASCERIFRPDLTKKPVIVLSSNDGCAVAMSHEVKKLGIKVGDPVFKHKNTIRQNQVEVFSSNFSLYENISNRVMITLKRYTDFLEVYSIDEAFMNMKGMEYINLLEFGKNMRRTIKKEIGIPVCVGIGRTKVLSKLANHLAKKNEKSDGVVWLETEKMEDQALIQVQVEEIWGVGRELSFKLRSYGIKTAKELKDYPNDLLIQKMGTKKLRQIQDELRGISCLELSHVDKKKSITTSKSFGTPVRELSDLKQAVAHYISRAAYKLRSQQSVAHELVVYITTSPFKESFHYANSGSFKFETPTSDTSKLIKEAFKILESIYQEGYEYKKAGVELFSLVDEEEVQLSLLQPESDDKSTLMEIVDVINDRFGMNTVKFLACGIKNPWKSLCENKSPEYTTKIFEAPFVK